MRRCLFAILAVLGPALTSCERMAVGPKSCSACLNHEILFFDAVSSGWVHIYGMAVPPFADTLVLRWYAVTDTGSSSPLWPGGPTPSAPSTWQLLARSEFMGDSACKAFIVPPGEVWLVYSLLRQGVETWGYNVVGPWNSSNPQDARYYRVGVIDLLNNKDTWWAQVEGSDTTSFCPAGMKRDSIALQ